MFLTAQQLSNIAKIDRYRRTSQEMSITSQACLCLAGSRDDLGDFSKDNLQEALGNANLLHEKGASLCMS